MLHQYMKKANKKKYTFLTTLILLGVLGPLFLSAQGLPNPLGEVTDPNEIIVNVIKAFLGVLGVLALVIFIYGGLLLLISGGNTEMLSKGKRTLVWAIIGLAIILSSYGILKFVFEKLITSTS
ncbi:MAG: hypothetical protein A3E60_03060 [Candidatus Kerfeldbacteria bacterium RIFCSPHIGHO2_12_FULL_42_13]|nr:MAG: hypothetical protein A3E60_03060 [Candidatus Kerfeldbacteria bacterium RIFCSPHIGHO2_12_FULL_42_13]